MRKKTEYTTKLDAMKVAKICVTYTSTNKTIREIAQEFNTSRTTVNKILRQGIPHDDYEILKKGKRLQNNHYNKRELAKLQTT